MIYLKLFWISAILFWGAYILAGKLNWTKVKQKLDEYGMLFTIWLTSLVIIAIVTKDPLELLGMPIPAEMQWLGSMVLAGFGAWRLYLNPLQLKVYNMDRELGEVKTRVTKLEVDMIRVDRYFEKIEAKIEKMMELLLQKRWH